MSYIGNQPTNTAFLIDTFSGNSVTTSFALSVAPATANSILVTIGGILQDTSAYGVVGRILTFSGVPPTGTNNISVRHLGLPASNVTTPAYRTVTDLTATAGQTTFSTAGYAPGFIDVYRNGVKLAAADFTATNGAQVVLVNPAIAGDTITTISFFVSSVSNAIPGISGSITPSYLDVTGQAGVGAMIIPTGTTAQRPTSPQNGMIRKNITTGYIEYWDPTTSSWLGIGAFSASGGTLYSNISGFNYHVFTSSGQFVVAQGAKNVSVLTIAGGGAGGGAGGADSAGGGGAGGLVYTASFLVTAGAYTVTVGGGAAGAGSGLNGSNGSNSQFGTLTTAIGGGGGSAESAARTAGSGGSGGGAGGYSGSPGSGTAGQGNNGAGVGGAGTGSSGGGGGAGSGGSAQNGGAGLSYSTFASATSTGVGGFYAGGGAGSGDQRSTTAGGTGGSGGGGNGAPATSGGTAGNGSANTGSGGGGAAGANYAGARASGSGGSGIVIVQYAI